MSRSGRKRNSKWDLKEEPQLLLGDMQSGIQPVHNKESQLRWHSPLLAGSTDSDCYAVESNNKYDREFLDVMLAHHGDGSYGTKMSPGLVDWRQKYYGCSPRNCWGKSYRSWSQSWSRSRSRSRSRSPLYGFKRESVLDERTIVDQICRDFAAGRCRRGDRCPYLHQDDTDYEDRRFLEDRPTNSWGSRHMRGGASKYSPSDEGREYPQRMGRSNDLCSDYFKDKCCRGASCKYAYHGTAFDKGSAKEMFKERENETSKYASFERRREYEPRRSGDIPCKFFAAGNCRKGKYCRFSHEGQTGNPDSRSWDNWRRHSSNFNTVVQSEEHPRLRDATVSHNTRLREWDEDRNENVAGREQRDAAYSKNNRWVHRFNNEKRLFGHPTNNDKAVDSNEREDIQPMAETTGADSGTGGFESKGAENWFCDMEISSPWNYGQSSGHIVEEENGRRHSSNFHTVEQSGEHPRLSDTTVSHNTRLCEWDEDRNENVAGREQRDASYSKNNRWVHRFNNEKRLSGHPTNNDKAVDSNKREDIQPMAETTGAGSGTGGFESKGAENWFCDMEISSPWNYGQSSGHIVEEENGHISQTSQSPTLNGTSVPTYEDKITGEILGQKHENAAAMAPTKSENACFLSNPSPREDASCAFDLEVRKASSDCVISSIDLKYPSNILSGRSLDQNGHGTSAVICSLSSSNAVGQNPQRFPLYASGGKSITDAQNQPMYQEDKSLSNTNAGDEIKLELTSEIPPTQNIVSREQLSQLTNLSALAQLFENVQQLSHLCAVPNAPKSVDFVSSSISNTAGHVNPLAAPSIDPIQVIRYERQYDPLGDSIESIKCLTDNPSPGLLPDPVKVKVAAGKEPELLSTDLLTSLTGGSSGGDQYKMGNLEVELEQECHQLDQLNPVANCDVEQNNGMEAEECKKAKEDDSLEKINRDGGADEDKKKNNAKGIRAFKFALVEFVKEILKPKWKEGQISKESHKNIVKKVVDKVTGSIPGAHIPQSQEKIDNYLSSAKPKLIKLVEAYVGKHQKS